MRKTIVITDLTQMPTSNRVCIVGTDKFGNSIRPIFDDFGVPKKLLFDDDDLIIRPRAKVQFDFSDINVNPPHIEDKKFDPDHIISKGICDDSEWSDILENNANTTVADIFDNCLHDNKWVHPGANTKSISTLSDPTGINVNLSVWDNKLKYRIYFHDSSRAFFDLSISDLAFREMCFKEIKKDGNRIYKVEQTLNKTLKSAEKIYLRLGLARPWAQPGSDVKRCYLQVTGIYSLPDYLQGKNFTDFLG